MDNEVKEEKQTAQEEPKKQEKPQEMHPLGKKAPKFNMNWIYGIIAIVLLGFMFMSPMEGGGSIEIPQSRFWDEMVVNHDVSHVVVVNHERVEIYIKPEKLGENIYAYTNKYKNRADVSGKPQYF